MNKNLSEFEKLIENEKKEDYKKEIEHLKESNERWHIFCTNMFMTFIGIIILLIMV